MTKSIFYRLSSAGAAIALAAALGGCGQPASDQQMTVASLPQLPATLPLATGAATNWPTAPAATALPAARPLRAVRVADPGDYYGYADAAYDYQDVLGDAPPDYAFDYDGVDPWAWEGYDQSVVFVEPIDDGYRYYYYRPGADGPYFVRDPHYGYGYDGDSLAVIYDDFGGVMPYADYGPRLDYASRYFARGRDLYAASRRAERRAVIAADWSERAASIADARARWANVLAGQRQWRDFHARTAPRDATYWREEAVRRQSDQRRFADWRAQDFRTPPPPRAIPQAWTRAAWASDQARFLPPRAERPQAAIAQAPRREGQDPDAARFDRRAPGAAPAIVAAAPNAPRGLPEGTRGGRENGPMRGDHGPVAMLPPQPDRPARERGNGNAFGRERGGSPAAAQLRGEPGQSGPRGGGQHGNPDRAARVQAQPQAEAVRAPRGNGMRERMQAQPQPQPQFRGNGNGDGGRGRPAETPRAQRSEAPRPQPQQASPRPQPEQRAQPQQRPQPQPQPQRGSGDGGRPGGGGEGKHGGRPGG